MNKQERLKDIGMYAIKSVNQDDIEFRNLSDGQCVTTLNTYRIAKHGLNPRLVEIIEA